MGPRSHLASLATKKTDWREKVIYKSDSNNSFHLPNGDSVRFRAFGGPENHLPPVPFRRSQAQGEIFFVFLAFHPRAPS